MNGEITRSASLPFSHQPIREEIVRELLLILI